MSLTPVMEKKEILIAEDNPGDVELIRESVIEMDIPNNISIVGDGVEAWDFIRQKGQFKDAPIPDLILLDLNLPKKNGWSLLQLLKKDKQYRKIPVVVLTSSESDDDIQKAYANHANCYVTKPSTLDEYQDVIKTIGNFWFKIARLPEPEGG